MYNLSKKHVNYFMYTFFQFVDLLFTALTHTVTQTTLIKPTFVLKTQTVIHKLHRV